MEQIHENFVHEVREINERYASNQAVNNAVELRKHTLLYFFDDEQISLQYKAVSALEWLQDDFVFLSIRNPSKTLLKDYFIGSLPAIRGALAPLHEGEDVEPDQVKQFSYGGKPEFEDILFNLKTLTGKQKIWEQKQKELIERRQQGNVNKKKNFKKKSKKNKQRDEL